MITQPFSSAIELIRHPERMDRSTIPVIRAALEQYPYYQTLHLLLLQNMFKVHDPGFSSQLRASAVMVADRSVLFDMVEGLNYSIPVVKLEDDVTAAIGGDKTLVLIDNFLKGVTEQPRTNSATGKDMPEMMGDYSSYLEMLPDYDDNPSEQEVVMPQLPVVEESEEIELSPPVSSSATNADDSVESVAEIASDTITPEIGEEQEEDNEFTVTAIRQHLNDTDVEEPAPVVQEEIAEESQNKEYFTETMAGIYIKQQKYGQALEIIKAISADNPKKSVYFADQIRYLELLTRINKNKN